MRKCKQSLKGKMQFLLLGKLLIECMDNLIAATSSLWKEFFAYAHSAEFRQGMFVQIAGILIELVFLVIAVRMVIWVMSRAKWQQNIFLTSFFSAQFCRDSFLLLLRIGGVTDESAELRTALSNRKLDSLFSHIYYGNTENLRDLLQLRLENNAHLAGHLGLNGDALGDLSAEVDQMISKIDQSILLCASLDQKERSMQLYELRIAFFSLRDYLRHEARQRRVTGRSYIQLLTGIVGALLSSLFESDKRTLDVHLRNALRRHWIKFIIQLPFVLAHRLLRRTLAKIRKVAYLSSHRTNFFSVFLRLALKRSGMDVQTAAAKVGISPQLMESYTLGLKDPPHDEAEISLLVLREDIPPLEWNQLLMSTVLRDVDHQRPSPITVDAVKANASYWLSSLSNQGQSDADQIADLLMRLMFMRPMRW